jgi:Tfp pilus assembly protein PilP
MGARGFGAKAGIAFVAPSLVLGTLAALALVARPAIGADAPPPVVDKPVADKKPAPAAAAAPQIDPVIVAAEKLAALRKKLLKDEDFVENDDVNRDPFHSYLRLFVDKGTTRTQKIPAVFEKLGLEELALIAIITGDSAPRAMFRDPTGLGETVKKGDYISKSGARVTRILSDRVVVEQMETNAKGEPHPVERAILVDPDEAVR